MTLTADDFRGRTNAAALIEMISENLPELIYAYDDTGGLANLFCVDECPHGDYPPESACMECISKWLRRPYSGEFDVYKGRLSPK